MMDDTSTSKADVENWRRGYEAALCGKAFVCPDNRNSAWRLGYRDGRAKRLKLCIPKTVERSGGR
jgi:ribosome modulation factor